VTSTEFDIEPIPALPDIWRATLSWCPTADQQQTFQALYAGILSGNRQMNLTRITAPQEFWEKHLWDSLSGIGPWLPTTAPPPDWCPALTGSRVIDIGTGAGFPGLPVAVVCPDWQVTLLDSTQKKIRWLQELAQSLGLGNVRAIAERAEHLAHQPSHRELYDVALVRAVGAAATCAEYALPLVKVGGIAVLYRGQWTAAETEQLAAIIPQLGGTLRHVQNWHTPLSQGSRHCVYLQKTTPTPEDFPRPVGIPAKQPLTETPSKSAP
jgi:16S rRNA (guanine527-N7)-methyltransferase